MGEVLEPAGKLNLLQSSFKKNKNFSYSYYIFIYTYRPGLDTRDPDLGAHWLWGVNIVKKLIVL